MFAGCSEFSANVIVKHKQHDAIIWSFSLPGDTSSFFQCLGVEKKLLGCGLLGVGVCTQDDSMASITYFSNVCKDEFYTY